jgi:hypothetical protein
MDPMDLVWGFSSIESLLEHYEKLRVPALKLSNSQTKFAHSFGEYRELVLDWIQNHLDSHP